MEKLEVSVVIPCLNERETVGTCVKKALESLRAASIPGEVVVADNGSDDGSAEIARQSGARVVAVAEPGYGSALMGGITASRGRFVVMGDADDSYDFGEVPRFVEKLREGFDLVQGCRLPAGGGRIEPGAMPFLHRRLGNPLLTWLVRRMFGAGVHDVYCGMRGFTREFYDRLEPSCTGMEFATEMIVKSALHGAATAEVPITLHRDGRTARRPHLRTFRDGWRTLRFYLLYSPLWLFVVPGLGLSLAGLLGFVLGFAGVRIGPAELGGNTVAVAGLLLILGSQSVILGIYSNVFAVSLGLRPPNAMHGLFTRSFRLEQGILAGSLMLLAGFGLIAALFFRWAGEGFGPLRYDFSIRWIMLGVTLAALGFQAVMGSFLVSTLGLMRR